MVGARWNYGGARRKNKKKSWQVKPIDLNPSCRKKNKRQVTSLSPSCTWNQNHDQSSSTPHLLRQARDAGDDADHHQRPPSPLHHHTTAAPIDAGDVALVPGGSTTCSRACIDSNPERSSPRHLATTGHSRRGRHQCLPRSLATRAYATFTLLPLMRNSNCFCANPRATAIGACTPFKALTRRRPRRRRWFLLLCSSMRYD